jgi:hypothetical protein
MFTSGQWMARTYAYYRIIFLTFINALWISADGFNQRRGALANTL